MSDSESDWLPLEITTSKGPEKPSLATMPLPPTTTHTIETPTKMHSMPNASSSASTDSTSSDPADGEYNVLIQSLEDEETVPLTQQVEKAMKRTMSGTYIDDNMDGVYGNPLLPEVAAERMPPQEGGLIWNCSIIPDDYFSGGKLKRGLNARDFDHERQTIRPRRPSLPVTQSEFFSSITRIKGPCGYRYIFYGVLNGWPSLRCFELISLEERRQVTAAGLPSAKELMSGQILWKKIWDVSDASWGIEPSSALPKSYTICRAKLRGAPWTSVGWGKDCPGFVFWFEATRPEGPRLTHGTDMLRTVGDAKCSRIHMVSHRYAVGRESPRDRLTYHSICLLEWEHGNHCTVIELAYLNGLGGYKGKSNWYADKDSKEPLLYQAMPPEMICPWRTNAAEIRCLDVPIKSLDELKSYMKQYIGPDLRFVDPQYSFSHDARLTFRSKSHIAQYLINYITRDSSYADLKRNCQTFTADLCAFLAGKKDIAPYHPVSRIDFQNRTYFFLYDSHMYESKEAKKKKKQYKTCTSQLSQDGD